MFLNEATSEEAREYLEKEREASGFVMNLVRGWAWRPDVAEAFADLRAQLSAKTTLSMRERAVMVCAAAGASGDSYCSLAWGSKLAELTSAPTAADVLRGRDAPDLSPREAALRHWADQVARDANAIQAADVEALRTAGLTDREIFEATAFVAFRMAFSTVNDALGARPDKKLAVKAPKEVRDAVTYGRPAVG
jgi:uncharacterized peroxidase-related enzyme